MDERVFDRLAAEELAYLEKRFADFDPDEVESDYGLDVLTLTLGDGQKVVVNSHRAARQIWMAAFRQAWHFDPVDEGGRTAWRTAKEELRATLGRLLTQKLGRPVSV